VLELEQLVTDFAKCIELADAKQPQAKNVRTKKFYHPGFGPHPESQAVNLVADELQILNPTSYEGRTFTGIPYPAHPHQKCDLCIGDEPSWDWSVEVKMLRFIGDNGKPNDNMLMHILSPYPQHRSALTDCSKLVASAFPGQKAVLIYGFDSESYPLEPAISAFEVLASKANSLGRRCEAYFANLVHPYHQFGAVYGWEVRE
jgi:hypothetical protein